MAKKAIVCDRAPKAVGPYSHANEANGFLFLSGMLGLDPATGKLEDSLEAQTERSLSNIKAVLSGSGLDLSDVVKTTVFLTDMKDFPAVNAIYARHFSSDFPSRSCIAVAGLPLDARVEIESIAALR
jgi:2-iminobutanoate/2-iminopropanoate deaminase